MNSSFLVHGIIGDGRMLATIGAHGELERLFWPKIDFAQQLQHFAVGVRIDGGELMWLEEHQGKIEQYYIEDTNVLITYYLDVVTGLHVKQTDFIAPGSHTMVRHLEWENSSNREMSIRMYTLSEVTLGDRQHGMAVRFDLDSSYLVHYHRDTVLTICGDIAVAGYQAGNTVDAIKEVKLRGAIESLGRDGALVFDSQVLVPGAKQEATLLLVMSDTQKKGKIQSEELLQKGYSRLFDDATDYWKQFLSTSKLIETGHPEVDLLYRRSLLVFGLMTDAENGGFIAAPEFDPGYVKSGGYGYCWGRDAAFIATAADKAGLTQLVGRFYDFAISVQEESGEWDHRHYLDGYLAPSWGLQIDETASLIWGMWQHFLNVQDLSFLLKVWPSMEKGSNFLMSKLDNETGLPQHSVDLWEERLAEHTYSAGAVAAALLAVSDAGHRLGKSDALINEWKHAAQRIATAIENDLWNESRQSYLRGVKWFAQSLNNQEQSDLLSSGKASYQEDDHGYQRLVIQADDTIDVSLLGLIYPFAIVDAKDQRSLQLATSVYEALWVPGVGGLLRYEKDQYIGGNPWILSTLWQGIVLLRQGRKEDAEQLLFWTIKHKTGLGLLPEQIDRETGAPRWVVPLTWSHAMYVLLVNDLYGNGDSLDTNIEANDQQLSSIV